jgi:hypothetical protein
LGVKIGRIFVGFGGLRKVSCSINRAVRGWSFGGRNVASHPSQSARRMERIPREEQMFLPAVAAMGYPNFGGWVRGSYGARAASESLIVGVPPAAMSRFRIWWKFERTAFALARVSILRT